MIGRLPISEILFIFMFVYDTLILFFFIFLPSNSVDVVAAAVKTFLDNCS